MTDHLSFYGRNHPQVIAQLRAKQHEQIATTAINIEEQLRGRLAQVAEAKKLGAEALSTTYQRLIETVLLLNEFQVLQYSTNSDAIYQSLKA